VTAPEKILMGKEEVADYLKRLPLEEKEVFMTLGAGDIDRLTGTIAEILLNKR
jgi:spore coat polysaccharide biosynthesis predicted glycosyltransferase SpsG